MGVLVQVRQCTIHPDGSADVMLDPVAYVSLERVWERPDSGHLCEASCLRMGRAQAQQMEHNQRNHSIENEFHRFAMNIEGLDTRSVATMQQIISHLFASNGEEEIENMLFPDNNG